MHEFPQTYDVAQNAKKIQPEFFVGALVGAGVALLLAPAAGKDTRRAIGEKAQNLGTGARGMIDRTRQTLVGIKEDARSAIQAGRESYQRNRLSRGESDSWSSRTI